MHLSPLGFATCQSKKYTNHTRGSFRGVHLSQVHHPSKNVNYRKKFGALDSFVGHLIALSVHFLLWQAAKPSGDKCTPLKVLYIIRCSRWT